jgi:hypothetical protein
VAFLEWVGKHPVLSVVLLAVLVAGIGTTVVGFEAVRGAMHVRELAVQLGR